MKKTPENLSELMTLELEESLPIPAVKYEEIDISPGMEKDLEFVKKTLIDAITKSQQLNSIALSRLNSGANCRASDVEACALSLKTSSEIAEKLIGIQLDVKKGSPPVAQTQILNTGNTTIALTTADLLAQLESTESEKKK